MNVSKRMKKAMSLQLERADSWILERRQLDIPIEEFKQARPDILLCISPERQMVVGFLIIARDTPESEIIDWALEIMMSPQMGEPHRPGAVSLYGGGLKCLKPVFEQLGVDVDVRTEPHPMLDELLHLLERDLTSPGMPPYTEQKEVDPDTIADFFKAAAEFYKLQPWDMFDFEIPVKLEFKLKKPKTYWAVIMGISGEELGVSVYESSADILSLFNTDTEEEAFAVAQRMRSVAFSYEELEDIGPVAQNELRAYKWVIVDESAYPSALVIDPKSKEPVRRLKNKELIELTAIVRVLNNFINKHEEEIEELEDFIVDSMQVEIDGKPVDVVVNMPAPEFVDEDDLIV